MGRTRGMADPTILNQVLCESFGWNSYDDMAAAYESTRGSKENNKSKKKMKKE
jgi:aspartyl-tRNA(Asn)/glutamyl-tRNA(Gln) amidotransferase subunit B